MATRQAELAARDDHAVDPRHQARRGRPGPDHRARRAARRLGRDALDRLLALAPLPDPGFGNLLWQAVARRLAGVAASALHGYAEKAMREAGDRTTWTEPDAAYEAAVHAAVDAAFDDPRGARRCSTGCSPQVAGPGWSNALAAKLVALTMPGVPDVYQGSELWEQSLVDPDNRRPVDFDAARRAARRARRDARAADRRRRRPGRRQAAGHPRAR